MPGFSGTGPLGYGPMTGRGMGPCGGGMGLGRGYGMGYGRGRGIGYGWADASWDVTKEEEKELLEREIKVLQNQLEQARKRITEIKGRK